MKCSAASRIGVKEISRPVASAPLLARKKRLIVRAGKRSAFWCRGPPRRWGPRRLAPQRRLRIQGAGPPLPAAATLAKFASDPVFARSGRTGVVTVADALPSWPGSRALPKNRGSSTFVIAGLAAVIQGAGLREVAVDAPGTSPGITKAGPAPASAAMRGSGGRLSRHAPNIACFHGSGMPVARRCAQLVILLGVEIEKEAEHAMLTAANHSEPAFSIQIPISAFAGGQDGLLGIARS